MRRAALATTAVLSLITALHAAPPHYTIQPLPPNTLLNNNGLIAIPPELLQPNIRDLSVNDAGEFAGYYIIDRFGESIAGSTFIWLPSPAHGLPAGFTQTTDVAGHGGPVAINNQGQATGTIGETPYLWAPQAAPGISAGMNYIPTSLYQPGTSPWAFATALNDSGQVVGYDMLYPGRVGGLTPFVWSPYGTNNLPAGVTHLIPPNGIASLMATAINNKGVIVGDDFLFAPQTVGGIVQGFHPLDGAPTDINDLNQVVGATSAYAFLWTPSTGLLDLNALIPPNSGWTLTDATQINNRGDIIGTGTLNGQPASFFLTLPEPALLPALLLPLSLTRRRR